MELKDDKLLKGAAILGMAAVVSKVVGTLQKIPLQNIAGDGAFGIYNTVYPFYILILFLATAGIPIAISKFVAERQAVGDQLGIRQVLRVSMAMLMVTGIICFAGLYFGAQQIANWIDNQETILALRSVSYALLVVPMLAALRGYFQGLQNMMPTAVSQTAEQVVRVSTMMALLFYCVNYGYSDAWIAAGATFGSVTGAFSGLCIMLYYWRKYALVHKIEKLQAVNKKNQVHNSRPSSSKLAKDIAVYAIPICLGSIAVPILSIADAFTVPRVLKLEGWSDSEVMSLFGIYNRGLPLVQLVAMIVSSISVALVPAMAEAKIRGQHRLIQYRAELAMRITWMITFAASVGLSVLALSINRMLYQNEAGTLTMVIVSFVALFSSLQIVSGSLLQGAGAVKAPVVILLLATALKIGLNLLLIPLWGIEGAAVAAVVAYGTAALLNMAVLRRQTGIDYPLRRYVGQAGSALLLMAVLLMMMQYGWHQFSVHILTHQRLAETVFVFLSIAVGAYAFGFTAFRSGAVSVADLQQVPGWNSKLSPILKAIKLLPKGV